VFRPEENHDGGERLERHASTQGRAVGASPIAHDADEQRPDRKRDLIDSNHETDEGGEAFARPFDGEDEPGQRGQIPDT
jgi:hypothetical protein